MSTCDNPASENNGREQCDSEELGNRVGGTPPPIRQVRPGTPLHAELKIRPSSVERSVETPDRNIPGLEKRRENQPTNHQNP
jgi:hypothetical protein